MPDALARRAATAMGWPNTLSPHETGLAIEGVWPALFYGSERIPEMRRKTAHLDWARAALDLWRAEAETVLRQAPQLPPGTIGWRHDFYSPTTAEHLLFDPSGQDDRFVDPWDGGLHGPDAEDGSGPRPGADARRSAWRLFVHERTYRLMHALGVLHALTGQERYAAWVAQGMRAALRTFERQEFRGAQGRRALYFQPLYDAQVLLYLATAYDLTRTSSAYTGDDHQAIRTGIFERAVPHQIDFLDSRAPQNMFAYVDAALVAAGDAVERPDWRRLGYEHPRAGFWALLDYGLRRDARGETDGFWVEGTQFYHLYSVCPLVLVHERAGAEQARSRSALTALLDAPRRMADERLRIPTFGDLGAPKHMTLRLYRHLYEYAAGQLDAERFGPALSHIYAGGTPRTSLHAVAYGPDALQPAGRLPRRSAAETFGAMGIAFLRRSDRRTGESYQAWLRAGAHGEGHDHPDKLSIGLHAAGEVLISDLGTAGYGLGEHTAYCRSTFSHSTLFVDEQPQARVKTASLRNGATWARGVVEDAFPGVRLERRLRLTPPYVLVQDRCTAAGEHRYGWALHIYGSLAVSAQGWEPTPPESAVAHGDLPPLPADGMFSLFTHRRGGATGGVVQADWRVRDGLWVRVLAWSDAPSLEWTAGQTPGNPIPDRRGTLVLRAARSTWQLRAVLDVHHGAPTLAPALGRDRLEALFTSTPFGR